MEKNSAPVHLPPPPRSPFLRILAPVGLILVSVTLLFVIFYITRVEQIISVASAPLYAESRWIVSEIGIRVKLTCVNWPSHLEPVLAEGLHKRPLDVISKKIRTMGFNCVRLTWPTVLATNSSLASMLVRDSFKSLGLEDSIHLINTHNQAFLDLTLIQAFQNVVNVLGDNSIVVILDNHVTTPGWCCNDTDGNGFFGDRDFDPQLWIKGLTKMATLFKGNKNVIGMSLRNELRGPRQNVSAWYSYMQQGAEAVHKANPDVLLIFSGLDYARNLSFLKKKPMDVEYIGKLVFEGHWYGFSDGDNWKNNNANDFCGSFMDNIKNKFGFLLEQGYPVILSEFGADQGGGSVIDNRYLSCLLGVIAEWDMDWAWWGLQGSYYMREGENGTEDEVYGMLSPDWSRVRNSSLLQRLSAVQPPFQGPGFFVENGNPYVVILHTSSGFCVEDHLRLGSCDENKPWIYTPEKRITLGGTGRCLHAVGVGLPPKLRNVCKDNGPEWELISRSKMHLSTKLANGKTVCLDVNQNGEIITNPCKCLEKDPHCDPTSQWFKVFRTQRT